MGECVWVFMSKNCTGESKSFSSHVESNASMRTSSCARVHRTEASNFRTYDCLAVPHLEHTVQFLSGGVRVCPLSSTVHTNLRLDIQQGEQERKKKLSRSPRSSPDFLASRPSLS